MKDAPCRLLFNLIASLGFTDEVDESLADFRVEVLDDVLLLRLREAHKQRIIHLG